eukprot:scaffold116738_cov64-Phaeocystis_antarctica.AAC.4
MCSRGVVRGVAALQDSWYHLPTPRLAPSLSPYTSPYLLQPTSTGLKEKRDPVSPHCPKQSSAAMTSPSAKRPRFRAARSSARTRPVLSPHPWSRHARRTSRRVGTSCVQRIATSGSHADAPPAAAAPPPAPVSAAESGQGTMSDASVAGLLLAPPVVAPVFRASVTLTCKW